MEEKWNEAITERRKTLFAQFDNRNKTEKNEEENQMEEKENKESSDEYEESINSSDEEIAILEDFNEEIAWDLLANLKDCAQITLTLEAQKETGLEVGPNVTSELPWKQIKKEILDEYFHDEDPERTYERADLLLVGYAACLSETADTYLVFETEESALKASLIIKQMEAFERRKIKCSFLRKPKTWKSNGSENEINVLIKRTNVMELEVESVYPLYYSNAEFSLRTSDDVRDGYVELLPGKEKYENLQRKRIDIAVQSTNPRIDLEQQTNPTFPTNAWSQYLYEIVQDDKPNLGEDTSEHRTKTPVSQRLVETSDEISPQVQELLNTLEFNQVDMYRNDYPFINRNVIAKHHVPHMTESFCFSVISKTSKRLVSSIAWHPIYSGITVTSYSFSTLSTDITESDETDLVQRAVISPNPVLMWSFDDTLNPKLQFESPREISILSFCPYDENILIGGFKNGQIIIWDLKDKIQKVEEEEVLTANQIKYRAAMKTFLSWTKEENRNMIVRPAAVSSMEHSHKYAVTCIKWLNRRHYMTSTGQVSENPEVKNRCFVTSSLDGTISFWDLDSPHTVEGKKPQKKKILPDIFIQETSEFKKYDRFFRPTYSIIFNNPITSFILDEGIFRYHPILNPTQKRKLFTRVRHKIEEIAQEPFQHSMTVTTMSGEISKFSWEGYDFDQGAISKQEVINESENFTQSHDGPILMIEKNPFLPEILLTIGRTIVSIWKIGFNTTPILWRKRPCLLTACQWSNTRPGVFFLTRNDGSVEGWDLISRTDAPCLIESLGGNTLTAFSQHKLSLSKHAFAIGDYNSNFRILLIPPNFVNTLNEEIQYFEIFINREILRKQSLFEWQKKWLEKNQDIIGARIEAANKTKADFEKLENQKKHEEEFKNRLAAEELRKKNLKDSKKIIFDLPERLEAKWDEMNFKRQMKILMIRKRVDPELLAKQTKPKKDIIKYNEEKKIAIKESFMKIDEDIASIRARLLPMETRETDRLELVNELVEGILTEELSYEQIEIEALEWLQSNQIIPNITNSEIIKRGRQRRELINVSVGSNIIHRNQYKKIKKNRRLSQIKEEVSLENIHKKSVTFSENLKTNEIF